MWTEGPGARRPAFCQNKLPKHVRPHLPEIQHIVMQIKQGWRKRSATGGPGRSVLLSNHPWATRKDTSCAPRSPQLRAGLARPPPSCGGGGSIHAALRSRGSGPPRLLGMWWALDSDAGPSEASERTRCQPGRAVGGLGRAHTHSEGSVSYRAYVKDCVPHSEV